MITAITRGASATRASDPIIIEVISILAKLPAIAMNLAISDIELMGRERRGFPSFADVNAYEKGTASRRAAAAVSIQVSLGFSEAIDRAILLFSSGIFKRG